jgi:hypothetical protein
MVRCPAGHNWAQILLERFPKSYRWLPKGTGSVSVIGPGALIGDGSGTARHVSKRSHALAPRRSKWSIASGWYR